ncbi:MAG: alpha/beta fold hydrolase [Firmicutes bacterium]|nr:alpha/beta fold hydrolase [Bacillota bacterium]
MKYYLRLLLILMVLVNPAFIFAQVQEPSAHAQEVIYSMSKGDFQIVVDQFDDTMKKAISLDKLQQLWQGIVVQCGPLKRQGLTATKKAKQAGREYDVTVTTCEFEKTALDIQLSFDSSGKIAGLYFKASQSQVTPPKRPQIPLKPYPYDEKEVTYENTKTGVKLAGTLTLPRGMGKFPAALLISGSGQQDRDETIMGHKPFLILADYLTRRGIAVLRVDDQGEGGSTGDPATATSEDFAVDVLAGIEFLKKQSKINAQKIGLIGHSEGGIIAPMAALKSKNVAFIVLMASPGLPGDQVLATQLAAALKAAGKSAAAIASRQELQTSIFAVVKQEKDNAVAEGKLRDILNKYLGSLSGEEKKQLGDPEAFIKQQIQTVLLPWMRFYLSYDPRPALRKVKCPVLAINGAKDFQVIPKENLAAIRDALKQGGNPDFQTKELPGLNHLLQTCQTGLPDEYYKIKETIAPIALKTIGDWIVAHTKTK